MDTLLDDCRVLDCTGELGALCGRILGDLGADVIKVEPPEGDLTRTAQPRVSGIPVYFAQQNCGKRCISIDVRTEAGREILQLLSARCHVLLENFRPGVMDRLGLGYEQVRAHNPGVVYCSITGYGQEGPAAGRRAYAPVMHAEMGLMELTARKLGLPVQPEAVSHADLYTGLQAAIGVLAALLQREHTGRGQHIDVSMAEVMLQATEWTAVELAGGEGDRFHVFGGFNAPVLRLGDGTVVCVPGDPVSTFPAWSRAMGRPGLVEEQSPTRWQGNRQRLTDRRRPGTVKEGRIISAEELGDLDCGAADSATCSENKNILAGLEFSATDQHVPGGLENKRNRGGFFKAEVLRVRHAVYFGSAHKFGAAAVNHIAQVRGLTATVINASHTS